MKGIEFVIIRADIDHSVDDGRGGGLSSIGFLVRPLRGRMEEGNQGAPLKPRQGPRPWTPLFIITIQPDLILLACIVQTRDNLVPCVPVLRDVHRTWPVN